MSKFVIERQYLVPMFQHIVVEAETLDAACTKAISNDIDWNTQEMDCDGARETTLTFVKEIPAGLDETRGILWDRSENPDRPLAIAPVTFLSTASNTARCSRSPPSLLKTNNSPPPLGSS